MPTLLLMSTRARPGAVLVTAGAGLLLPFGVSSARAAPNPGGRDAVFSKTNDPMANQITVFGLAGA